MATVPVGVPLVVSPRTACKMLNVGLTRCYELLNSGAIQSYKEGASRQILTKSIYEYVERKLADGCN